MHGGCYEAEIRHSTLHESAFLIKTEYFQDSALYTFII